MAAAENAGASFTKPPTDAAEFEGLSQSAARSAASDFLERCLILQSRGFEGVGSLAEHEHTHDLPGPKGHREVAMLVNACPTSGADSPLVDCEEHSLTTCVAYVLNVIVPVLPRVGPCLHEWHHLVAPSIQALLRPSSDAGHVPLKRRVVEALSGQRITTRSGQERLQHDLDVLPRHRLLPKAVVDLGAVAVQALGHGLVSIPQQLRAEPSTN